MTGQSLEQAVGELQGRMTSVEREVRSANEKLDRQSEILATAKGGWRMLLLVGTAVAGFVGVLVLFGQAIKLLFGRGS